MRFDGAGEARVAGVSTVFQELTLLPNLTIAENLFLGREPKRFGFIDRAAMRRRARAVLDRVGVDLDVDVTCGELAIAEQHLVEIAKGAAVDAEVIIYDEPTAALDAPGVDKLVRLIREQRSAGKLVFYISHRLDEIFRLCDTTTVLKDGKHVATCPTADLTRDALVSLMVGRELAQLYPTRKRSSAKPGLALDIKDLVAEHGQPPVSFQVNRCEIVGLTGLEGQGQRAVIRALAGLVPSSAGAARKYDREGAAAALASSIVATARAGVGFIPEDRKSEGLYQPLSIEQNIGLGMLRRAALIATAKVDRNRVKSLMRHMNVRARDQNQLVSSLSGGNQQKVMIGRWLASGVDVLLDRGADARRRCRREVGNLSPAARVHGQRRGRPHDLERTHRAYRALRPHSRHARRRDRRGNGRGGRERRDDHEIRLDGTCARPGGPMTKHRALRFGRSGLGLVSLALPVVVFILLSLGAPDFFSFQNLANVNSQVTALMLVALGQLIVALIGGIDISVGSVVSLTSVLIVTLDPSLAVPAVLAMGLVVGLANGFGVTVFGVHPLIMTLASMTFVQGLALLFEAGAGGTVPAPLIAMAKSSFAGIPAALLWCIVAIVAAWLLLYKSPFGLRVFAIGANAQSAELSGVRVTAPRIACYTICSLAGAIAGIYLTGRIASGDPTMGQPFGLDSVTAIALGGVQLSGGVGSVFGAVLGTITLGLIANGINLLGISPFFRAVVTGALLLGAVSLQRRKAIGI